MKRVPLQPLLAVTGLSISDLADRLDAKRNTVAAWTRRGIPVGRADEVAVAAGEVAFHVWPELLEMELAKVETRQCRDCPEVFMPVQPSQVYCSQACKSRFLNRRRYERDEEYREAKKAAAVAYYAEMGEAARAEKARRDLVATRTYRRTEKGRAKRAELDRARRESKRSIA